MEPPKERNRERLEEGASPGHTQSDFTTGREIKSIHAAITDAQVDDTVVVGIPTYNEEIAIGSVILRSQRVADEVIVVDDASTDRTVEIAEAAGATVITHQENKGKGAAIQTLLGYVQGADLDTLVLIDGDGQHDPANIPRVTAAIREGDCDMVIGSRYLGSRDTETPRYRRIGQRTLDYLTLGSSGKRIKDSQSGFRALSAEAVSTLTVRTDGMAVESEMIGQAADHGFEIREVPIDVRYDGIDGQTHHPMRHGITVASLLIQLIRDRHPLLFFGLPAVIMLTIGGVVMVHSLIVYQTTGLFYHWRVPISGFLILLGTLSMFCGLVLSQIRSMMSSQVEEGA